MAHTPQDDRAEIPAAGPQLVRWLRALADAVERDPALAARIAAEMAPPPDPSPSDDGAGERVGLADRAGATEPELAPPAIPPDNLEGDRVALAQPIFTVRHSRRTTKYGAPTVAGRAPELGAGVPDPFAIVSATGEEGLQRALATLRTGSLRAIIRTHQLDPKGKLPPNATDQRMITVILTAVKKATAPAKPKKGKRA